MTEFVKIHYRVRPGLWVYEIYLARYEGSPVGENRFTGSEIFLRSFNQEDAARRFMENLVIVGGYEIVEV